MSGPGRLGDSGSAAPTARSPTDITRVTLQVLAIGALLGASLWIARPFIGPLIWAVMVAGSATSP